jgi:hypothetical protein
MSDRFEQVTVDGVGVDMELHVALKVLDPGEADPGYWSRFGEWVVAAAGPELARRQIAASLTVGDVLAAWARTLVPTAMMAAAVAGMLLLRAPRTEALPPLGIEELLVSELQGLTIPQISPDAPGNPATLLAEIF